MSVADRTSRLSLVDMMYSVDVRLRQPPGTPPLDVPQQHGVARILRAPLRRHLDREFELLVDRAPAPPPLRVRPHANGAHLLMYIHAASRLEAEDRAYAIAKLAVIEGILLANWRITSSRARSVLTRAWHCAVPDLSGAAAYWRTGFPPNGSFHSPAPAKRFHCRANGTAGPVFRPYPCHPSDSSRSLPGLDSDPE